MAHLLNEKVLDKYIQNYSIKDIKEKLNIIKNWTDKIPVIKKQNEINMQGKFLIDIFCKVLGYKDFIEGNKVWNLKIEEKTEIDAEKPDGIIGFYMNNNDMEESTQGVIELKSPNVSFNVKQKRNGKIYGTPVDQGYKYTSKYDKCGWVIVSNFLEIRLYKVGRSQEYFERFMLKDLANIDKFKRFYFLLCKKNLISKTQQSTSSKLCQETIKREKEITIQFYKKYKKIRINLYNHLKTNHYKKDDEVLLEKAQKFLDRIIFIVFCESRNLLPEDLLYNTIDLGKKISSLKKIKTGIWEVLKETFKSIDEGNISEKINAYNGGLFKYDKILDEILIIENNFFEKINDITKYDFNSDLDVNILGHILEQSIMDMEEFKAKLNNKSYDKDKSKRKKEGIYYTPHYVTHFIINNTLGSYINKIKVDLKEDELPDIESAPTKSVASRYKKIHLNYYENFINKLRKIKILDMACGSGAFLIATYNYLYNQYQWAKSQIKKLKNEENYLELDLGIIQKDILINNLFGVDKNDESVEITKLALWLKTANPGERLINLDDNIKCGNSLLEVSKKKKVKCFDWQKEFKEIMNDGGFDIIIGNPPYVKEYLDKSAFDGLRSSKYYQGKMDIWTFFGCKAIDLLKSNGYLSFIALDNWITNTGASIFRNKMLNEGEIIRYIDFGEFKVFDDADPQTMIFIYNKKEPRSEYLVDYAKVQAESIQIEKVENFLELNFEKKIKGIVRFPSKINIAEMFNNYIRFLNYQEDKIINKIINESNYKLNRNDIGQGIICPQDFVTNKHIKKLGEPKKNIGDGIFVISSDKKSSMNLTRHEENILKPYYTSKELKRFFGIQKNKYWIIYTSSDINDQIKKLPNIKKHLDKYAVVNTSKYAPYGLHRARNEFLFKGEKIISKRKTDRPCFTYTEFNCYVSQTYYVIKPKRKEINLKYLTGVLNSSLMYFWFKKRGKIQGNNLQIDKEPLLKCPLVIPTKKKQQEIIEIVEKIMKYENHLVKNNEIKFLNIVKKYASLNNSLRISQIADNGNFYNEMYSGNASVLNNLIVDINENILTISDKNKNDRRELIKFKVEDKYSQSYIKLFLEHMSNKRLQLINQNKDKIIKKVKDIELYDYNKKVIVKTILNEWENLQTSITNNKKQIKKLNKILDKKIYKLYNLSDKEISIIIQNLSN
ncbi:MAG: Eco57I restriction-modification methylase domain-containing protein [archaeon]